MKKGEKHPIRKNFSSIAYRKRKRKKMKIAINILKAFEIILTAIWGVIFGILTPLSLMYGGIVADEIAQHYILKIWLLNSIVCYLIGTIVVMLKHYKTALGFHGAGLIVSIFIYGVFQNIYKEIEAQNPAQLYMPVIFITLITLAITVMANYKKITERLSAVNNKKYEAAPSVLGGEQYTDNNKEQKKKGRKK